MSDHNEFQHGEQVIVAPDFSNDDFVAFEGIVTMVEKSHPADPNPMYHIKDGDGNEDFWMAGNVRHIRTPKTKDPVRHNFVPDDEEVHFRRAIHVLSDCDTEIDVILMADGDQGIYLNAFINGPDMEDDESIKDGKEVITPRPQGTVEYMVCDGLPGHRCNGHSFYNLKEAIEHFKEMQAAGGWQEWCEASTKQASKD